MGRYLDLTSLRSGDVLLTSESSLISRAIVLAQRIIHLKPLKQGFSHATLVINPVMTFDTRFCSGARFRTLRPDKISEISGRIRIWHDVSQYKSIAVIRFGGTVDSEALFRKAIEENTRPYARPMGFFSLLHPKLKTVFHRLTFGIFAFTEEHQEKFCSSLTTELLQEVNGLNIGSFKPREISPFKLFDHRYIVTGIVEHCSPEYFCEDESHKTLLSHACVITGHAGHNNPDDLGHLIEDIVKNAANGTLLSGALCNDPSFHIQKDGEDVSLMQSPHLTQFESLRETLFRSNEFFLRLRRMDDCFEICDRCCCAASCSRDVLEQFDKIIADREKEFIQ